MDINNLFSSINYFQNNADMKSLLGYQTVRMKIKILKINTTTLIFLNSKLRHINVLKH